MIVGRKLEQINKSIHYDIPPDECHMMIYGIDPIVEG
jgi:hypothetical protein